MKKILWKPPDIIRTRINQWAIENHEKRERAKKYDKYPESIVTEGEKRRQLQEKEGCEIC